MFQFCLRTFLHRQLVSNLLVVCFIVSKNGTFKKSCCFLLFFVYQHQLVGVESLLTFNTHKCIAPICKRPRAKFRSKEEEDRVENTGYY